MSAIDNAETWLDMFEHTLTEGKSVNPRGQQILELEDFQLTFDPRYPFMGFDARKYNVFYFKREMIWKLGANRFDDSIKNHAKMWESVQNMDGSFNSNYGQYWFGEQQGFFSVIGELLRDKDSRRAIVPMLSRNHMTPETRDTVCTESVAFRIRDDVLNMSVHMRSSDQIFGLGTDMPTFSFLFFLVYKVLKDAYPMLQVGSVTITAMSSHIYARHFDMVKQIIKDELIGYKYIDLPVPTSSIEAIKIATSRGQDLNNCGPLGNWLLDN